MIYCWIQTQYLLTCPSTLKHIVKINDLSFHKLSVTLPGLNRQLNKHLESFCMVALYRGPNWLQISPLRGPCLLKAPVINGCPLQTGIFHLCWGDAAWVQSPHQLRSIPQSDLLLTLLWWWTSVAGGLNQAIFFPSQKFDGNIMIWVQVRISHGGETIEGMLGSELVQSVGGICNTRAHCFHLGTSFHFNS